MQPGQQLQHLRLVFIAHALSQQIVHQHADGVDRALRQGGVAADARGRHVPEARLQFFHAHPLRRLQLAGLHGGLRLVGDGVDHDAAADVHDIAQGEPEVDAPVVDALLPVAEGEVGVGAEAEEGCGEVRKVVLHVTHAALLIGAQQGPDRVLQRDVPLLQILQRVQAQDAGALVVHDAPADDPALPLPHGEGVVLPAVAGGDHVQVGDGGQIPVLRALAQLGVADLARAVHRLQAQLPGDLQALVQSGSGSRAEGRAGLRLPFHAVDGHETPDVPEYGVVILFREPIQVAAQCFVHALAPTFQVYLQVLF